MASSNIFLVGIGYIGHPLLDHLLATHHHVTPFVRRPSQAAQLQQNGCTPVQGNLSDLALLTKQTALHSVTINTSSSDDLPSVQAILDGIRQRIAEGKPTIFIHTSGTGALEDGANGLQKPSKIYRDDEPEALNALPSTSMHQHVDHTILAAAREFGDKAKLVIVMPPLVYGFDAKYGRKSFAINALVKFALGRGWAGYVGEGYNVWSVVHIRDLARAYSTILDYVDRAGPMEVVGNPWFFVENGVEVSAREWAENLARILHQMGRLDKAEVRAWVEEDYMEVVGPMTPRGFGSNSRSRAVRLRQLGWEAKEQDIWSSWQRDEVPFVTATLDSEHEQ
jgi:nucleoside-diphosphate-sugar epimerase